MLNCIQWLFYILFYYLLFLLFHYLFILHFSKLILCTFITEWILNHILLSESILPEFIFNRIHCFWLFILFNFRRLRTIHFIISLQCIILLTLLYIFLFTFLHNIFILLLYSIQFLFFLYSIHFLLLLNNIIFILLLWFIAIMINQFLLIIFFITV